ncbi:MAG: hypothetical protein J6126_03025 [Clostridia bacterium]|nr:hypothetical protein [Clostridia bacterium]
MKRKLRLFAACGLVFLLAVATLVGCKVGPKGLSEIIKEYDLNAKVTYYANGGVFETNKDTKEIYYTDGDQPININEATPTRSGTVKVTRSEFDFDSWYFASAFDENGYPVPDEGDEPVDFSIKLRSGDDWHIYARWNSKSKLDIRLVSSDGNALTLKNPDGEDAVYENSATMATESFGASGIIYEKKYEPVSGKLYGGEGTDETVYTFVAYYEDEECTTFVNWPVSKPEDGDFVIYAKYIPGEWKILRTANEFGRADFATPSNKFYLISDVDCSSVSGYRKPTSFGATLEGNGFTVTGLTVSVTNRQDIAFFGEIGASAIIRNVTFKDVNFTVKTSPKTLTDIYLFATGVSESATLVNVTFSGNLTVDRIVNESNGNTSEVLNFTKEGETYVSSNWLFGGFESDAQFLATFNGVTIDYDNTSFTVNEVLR